MNIHEKRELALKLYDLLKQFEYVEFQVFKDDEDGYDDKGNGFVSIDGVDFFFDNQGRIEKARVEL